MERGDFFSIEYIEDYKMMLKIKDCINNALEEFKNSLGDGFIHSIKDEYINGLDEGELRSKALKLATRESILRNSIQHFFTDDYIVNNILCKIISCEKEKELFCTGERSTIIKIDLDNNISTISEVFKIYLINSLSDKPELYIKLLNVFMNQISGGKYL